MKKVLNRISVMLSGAFMGAASVSWILADDAKIGLAFFVASCLVLIVGIVNEEG